MRKFNDDTLFLVLKSKWFNLIECGDKKEEYRELNKYWLNHLCQLEYDNYDNICGKIKDYKYVVFQLGYKKDAKQMLFDIHDITIDYGNSDWGAEDNKKYFVIKLGKRIN